MVTIKDVAAYAGVTISTVSRVINNKDRVSTTTREKVLRAINELGYVRNNLAASIKTGSTHFIVVVVPDIINEFYTDVISGAEKVASANGYYTLVYTTRESRAKEFSVFGGEFSHMVDGFLLVPSTNDVSLIRNVDKPTVLIDRVLPGNELYSVSVNNYMGSKLLVEELIKYGHRKIAIITGPSIYNVGLDRMSGYVDVLCGNHIPLREDYICSGSWYQEDGYRFTEQLLNMQDPPTAIFAANNLLCMGCVECICDRGLTIGKDISLVGFDDSLMAKYIGPGITGLRCATSEMGSIGTQMLISLLKNKPEEIKEKNVVLDVELIRRNSIALLY